MDATNTIVCMVRGHAFRKITHQGSAYRYCLKCGRLVWLHSHLTRARRGAPAAVPRDAVAEPA